MQEERHEPYMQPPPTEQEQAKAEEMTRPPTRRPEEAEQPAMRVEEAEERVQEMPTRPIERKVEERRETFFAPEQREQFSSRWKDIQIEFLGNPRQSAEDADRLIGEMVQSLNKQLTDECSKMEQEMRQGQPSTEDLRLSLGRYQSFFDRLISI